MTTQLTTYTSHWLVEMMTRQRRIWLGEKAQGKAEAIESWLNLLQAPTWQGIDGRRVRVSEVGYVDVESKIERVWIIEE